VFAEELHDIFRSLKVECDVTAKELKSAGDLHVISMSY